MTFRPAALGFVVAVTLPLVSIGARDTGQQDQPRVLGEMRLDPIPTSPRAVASEDVLQRVYEFTARHPEVVRYVPCFCGCELRKHESVESCFISARTPDGRVTWNAHGLACSLCVDVVEAARELHAQGQAVRDIRRLIMEKFHTGRITPTPEVPHQHHAH